MLFRRCFYYDLNACDGICDTMRYNIYEERGLFSIPKFIVKDFFVKLRTTEIMFYCLDGGVAADRMNGRLYSSIYKIINYITCGL